MRSLTKIINVNLASLDDAFQSPDWNRLAAVHGHNDLSPVSMFPFLMAASLTNGKKTVRAQNFDNVFGATNWKTLTQGRESSSTLSPFFNFIGEGSNHKTKASFAFSMASASESPAVAHPGNSGNTADHRLA
jgi:hypothetical protein